MARYNTNRYQYETSPRKLQPDYEPQKKRYPKKSTTVKDNNKNKEKSKAKTKPKARVEVKKNDNKKVILTIVITFAALFAISYRNGLIAQKYNEIKGLKSELTTIEKDNKQLEVNIEGKTNLGAIEAKASEDLGMKKLDDSQTVYVSLDKQDYIESSAEEVKLKDNLNWIQNIINKIKDII